MWRENADLGVPADVAKVNVCDLVPLQIPIPLLIQTPILIPLLILFPLLIPIPILIPIPLCLLTIRSAIGGSRHPLCLLVYLPYCI